MGWISAHCSTGGNIRLQDSIVALWRQWGHRRDAYDTLGSATNASGPGRMVPGGNPGVARHFGQALRAWKVRRGRLTYLLDSELKARRLTCLMPGNKLTSLRPHAPTPPYLRQATRLCSLRANCGGGGRAAFDQGNEVSRSGLNAGHSFLGDRSGLIELLAHFFET
jgi:hypothetical protein